MYPRVVVRQNYSIPEEDIYPFLDVYMIPDDKAAEFATFKVQQRFDFLRRENLPDANILSCTESVTREYHPDIWAAAYREVPRVGSTAKAKATKPHRKIPAKKSPARVQVTARR